MGKLVTAIGDAQTFIKTDSENEDVINDAFFELEDAKAIESKLIETLKIDAELAATLAPLIAKNQIKT